MHHERLESSQTTEFRVILGIVQTRNFRRKKYSKKDFFGERGVFLGQVCFAKEGGGM